MPSESYAPAIASLRQQIADLTAKEREELLAGSISSRLRWVLADLRKHSPADFTLAAIERQTKLSHAWVGYILNGTIKAPAAESLEKLSDYLGITALFLLGKLDRPQPSTLDQLPADLTAFLNQACNYEYIEKALRLAQLAAAQQVPPDALSHLSSFLTALASQTRE